MSRLIVKNLPLKITEDKLRNTFSSKGNITDLQLKYNKEGKFRGFAFIGFKNENEAEAARKHFDGTFVGAVKINVQTCTDLGDSVPASQREQKEEEVVLSKKSTQKNKKEASSILDKYKDDSKFQDFLRVHKRNAESWTNESVVDVANLYKKNATDTDKAKDHGDEDSDVLKKDDKDNNDVNHNETVKKKTKVEKKPKTEKIFFYVKVENIPYKFKKSNIKSFFGSTKPCSIRMPPHIKGIAYVGFKTEKERNQGLNKNKSLWEGRQIFVKKHTQKVDSGSNGNACAESNPKWKEQEEEVKKTETVGESGRIFARNLSYTATEESLTELFQKFGPLTEVNVPVDKTTRRIKGFAFVTFMMPEHAVSAFSELDGSTYQGRLLHLIPAKSKDGEDESEEAGSNFKKSKALKDKKESGKSHNWNSLFLGASAVADLMSEKYSVDKADIILGDDRGGKTAAVRLALGETQIVQETKKYLESEGVRLKAFDQPPEKRAKNIIIAKNLPAKTPASEMKYLFAKFGVLGRVLLPPGGITAIIEFIDPGEARKAFTNLAYTRFHNTPLYLEWAPEDTFTGPLSEAPRELKDEKKENTKDWSDNDEPAAPQPDSILFVKNLNFDTGDETLRAHFENCGKIYSCNVASKKNAKTGQKLSMGFGFVTFWMKAAADKALKELQHSKLDDHALELKRSNRASDNKEVNTRKVTKAGKPSTKILVRNVAFQATKHELAELFKIYGELSSVRLPKKLSGQHRGFGFIEFAAKTDAKKAMEELSGSTHLYGRRLVLEWEEQEETLDSLRKRTADQFNAGSRSAGKRSRIEMDENKGMEDMND